MGSSLRHNSSTLAEIFPHVQDKTKCALQALTSPSCREKLENWPSDIFMWRDAEVLPLIWAVCSSGVPAENPSVQPFTY